MKSIITLLCGLLIFVHGISQDHDIAVGNYGNARTFKIKAYDETLYFKPGWKWLSFPRLERYKDEPFDAINLLERINNWEPVPTYLEMKYEPDNIVPLNIKFIEGQWNTLGGLTQVESSKGYKLFYQNYSVAEWSLKLEGAKLDYDSEMDLASGDNWVGYFLDKSQDPEDCLPEDLWDKLVQIRTQNWSMTKITEPSNEWFIYGTKGPFHYGDLVILRLNTGETYDGFQWQNSGEAAEENEIPETEYYTYEEQSDYLPFYVETDSMSDIREIAVLAGGEVKGASVREAGDTIVEVKGYLQGVASGTPVEFETWNGYKSKPVEKNGYVVIDHSRRVREKRTIYTGEKTIYYHVSLKNNETYSLPPEIGPVTCKPNPFKQSVEFSFRLNRDGNIRIDIFDLQGNPVKTVINGHYPEGLYNLTWLGDNQARKRIMPGIYFYKVSVGNDVVQSDKLVLIK